MTFYIGCVFLAPRGLELCKYMGEGVDLECRGRYLHRERYVQYICGGEGKGSRRLVYLKAECKGRYIESGMYCT
jgi:hypothetical protein